MAFRRPLFALVLAAALALAPAAASAANWVVHGRGFGHGVGMSAYGAYGYAKHGKGYRFILGHYYTGTTVAPLGQPRTVRVLLDISPGEVGFSGATSACGQTLDPAREYRARRAGAAVQLVDSAGKALAPCGRKLRAAGAGTISIAGLGRYRGALETVPTKSSAGSLNVIDALSIEQYVKGVIPNESPPSWPLAELKAQAVASRSFALTTDVEGNGFDLYDDTRSQVYEGLESEYPRTNMAADATRGEVVTYDGEIAQTLFSACSGGHTESNENVFGTAVPYLVGVPDPYDYYCPLHSWELKFTGAEISARLGAYLDGALKRIVVTKRGVSPRIVEARLYGTGGVTSASGSELAAALGGHDTWMTFEKVGAGGPSGEAPAGPTGPTGPTGPPGQPGGIGG